MTLPFVLAFELASGGFYVANPCDSTAVARPELSPVETTQAQIVIEHKINISYS